MNFHRCSVESDARAILQCGVFFPYDRYVLYGMTGNGSKAARFFFTFLLFLFRKLSGSTEKSYQKISSRVNQWPWC